MDIREYLQARRNTDARRIDVLREARAAKEEVLVDMARISTELDDTIAAAREGLISPPTQGAAWNAEARYAAGDTVEGGYIALRFNRGKEPSQHLGEYWDYDIAEIVAWESIEDGTVIYADGIVSYGGVNWKCTTQHIKSTVYKPKDGSSKWERCEV